MSFSTTSTKYVICPLWGIKVPLHGHYRYSEEKGHEYEAKFQFATCPIVENLKLPKSKQNKDYALYSFCNLHPCEMMKNFQPIIDVRQGY